MENKIKIVLGDEQKEAILKEMVKELKEEIRTAILEANTFKAVGKKELAEMLSVSERTIDKWRKQGLTFIKIDNVVRYDLVDIKNWIENKKEGGK